MSLIGWWKLDSDAADSTLNGHDGVVNSVSWVNGKIGGAGSFNGSSSYISAPTISDYLHGRPEASIALWCKKNAVQYGFLQLSGYANTNGNLYPYDTETKVYLDVFRTDRLGPIYMPTSVLEWHHVVIVQEPGSWRLYQNGELVHEASANDAIATDYLQFEIGRNSDSRYANGLFDDVKVYDHALSTKEIKELSKAKVAHWKFDDFQDWTYNYIQDIGVAGHGSSWVEQTDTLNGLPIYRNTVTSPGTSNNIGFRHQTSTVDINSSAKSITLSFYAKVVEEPDVDFRSYIRIRYTDATESSHYFASGASGWTPTDWALYDGGTWKRVESSVNLDSSKTPEKILSFYVWNDNATIGTIDYAGIQIEVNKSFATQYVTTIRSAVISDASGNGHNITLDVDSPAWTESAKIGAGAYEFIKGSHATIGDIGSPQEFAVCFWVKPHELNVDANNNYRIIIRSNLGNFLLIEQAGGMSFRVPGVASANYQAGNIPVDDWSFVVCAYDQDYRRIYIDGILVGEEQVGPGVVDFGTLLLSTPSLNNSFVGELDDIRIYATALSLKEIAELYRQRGNLDGLGRLSTPHINETKHTPMITDYTIWEDGQTGSVGSFGQNGSTAENWRTLDLDPWGKETVVWESIGDTTSGADGGWNHYHYDIDPTKLYRYSVWWNPRNKGDGRFYLGTQGSNVANIADGTTNGNPYFISFIPPLTMQDKWFLVIGYVLPWDTDITVATNYLDSGVWDLDGNKHYGTTAFKWLETATAGRHRTYMYYSSDGVTRFQWAYPRVDICDGTEPSFADLMNGLDSRNVDYVRSIGGTTTQSFSVGSKSTKISTANEVGPSDGLTGWWPLDGHTYDYGGDIGDLVNSGATLTAGPNQAAYNFTTGGMSVTSDELDLIEYTYAFWVKLKSGFDGTYRQFIRRDVSGIGNRLPGMWFRPDDNRLHLRQQLIGVSYNGGADTTTELVLNEWTHIVFQCTTDGTNTTLNSFVNGVLDGTGYHPDHVPASGSAPLELLSTDYDMYDLRLYDRFLSPEEISTLYDLTAPDSGTMMKQTSNTLYLRGQLNEVSL